MSPVDWISVGPVVVQQPTIENTRHVATLGAERRVRHSGPSAAVAAVHDATLKTSPLGRASNLVPAPASVSMKYEV